MARIKAQEPEVAEIATDTEIDFPEVLLGAARR
jgi:hypothetical protein